MVLFLGLKEIESQKVLCLGPEEPRANLNAMVGTTGLYCRLVPVQNDKILLAAAAEAR